MLLRQLQKGNESGFGRFFLFQPKGNLARFKAVWTDRQKQRQIMKSLKRK
jgi:hypothetical protein